jgi:hypothetical protein
VVFSIEMWKTSVDVCELSRHTSTGHSDNNMKEVHRIVSDDSQGTISKTAGRLGLSHGTCKGILRVDLKLLQITSISVPW